MLASTQFSPSTCYLEKGELIKQGAEAKVYALASLFPNPTIYDPSLSSSSSSSSSSSISHSISTRTSSTSPNDAPGVILKYRFPKTYRHPTLDSALTSSRLIFEARALSRASRAGVVVPKVLWVDEKGGVIGLERIEGWSVREVLGGGAEGEMEFQDDEEIEIEFDDTDADADAESGQEGADERDVQGEGEYEEINEGWQKLSALGVTREHLMNSIGTALARLHLTTIIHGDLTTSNMMIRLTPNSIQPYEIVMIDFGLSSTAQFPENYAVDLYVLERAFASTHPKSEKLYAGVLEAYAKGLGEKKWRPIELKLKSVRRRGRKRDMSG
ncbi:Kae1-associated kinase Bud32 [Kwoniella shivajii]|uniref:non-specific serine/threonine protein kinase n=1 Tax=Kwoniella shivajii TaxID=564305 RepID=A0ABZ1CPF8_9TREE|nr:Kae1-associated kinase Bud32 [Kwoniella shivajii]